MALRSTVNSKDVLNHVLNLQRFSLANYLRFARPWASEPDHVLLTVVFGIAQAQQQHADRIGMLLVERHARAEPGTFPLRFTGLNDLSIRHVSPLVVEDLERMIHDLHGCAEALRDDSAASALVQAILRDEQRHLQILREEVGHLAESVRVDQQRVSRLNRGEKYEQKNGQRRRASDVRGEPIPA